MRYLGLALASALAVTGCNAVLGIDDLSLRDGGMTTTDVDETLQCYGGMVRACFAALPTAPLVLVDTIDTGTDTRCTVVTQVGGPDVCAIAGSMITMAGDTVVTGPRPLMLISTSTILVSKKLDASSSTPTNRAGPGANSALCDAAVNGVAGNPGGGSGGAGGSFLSTGGGGGRGDGVGAGTTTTANPPQQTALLRGGCPGGQGGNNLGGGGGIGGAGGNSGGAIYLVAQSIAITSELRASGGGGHRGLTNNAGGGGGGSGGMVVLEAATISVMAPGGEIVAHGAGGGEASHDTLGADGRDDRDWMSAPLGGNSQNDSGNGGTGAYGAMAATNGTAGGGGGGGGSGGGGGGGGHGAVRFRGQLGGAQISPPPVNF